MPAFKDSSGQSWPVEIGILTARKIHQTTGVNCYKLLDPAVLTELENDPVRFTDLLWCICEKTATDRGLDFETFLVKIADTIDQAFDAVVDAVVDLLPEKKRPAARKVAQALTAAGERVQALAAAKLETIDPAALADELVRRLEKEIQATATTGAPSNDLSTD